MKQMIQRIREEKSGFTLAELLIVVAIVAVLVAIAIPVFSAQLAKANAGTDEANIRSGYAQAQSFILTKMDNDKTKIASGDVYYLTTDAGLSKTGTKYETKGTSTDVDNVPGYLPAWTAQQNVKYTFTVSADTGEVTVAVEAVDKTK
ncbi:MULTISPECIES: prepilin-type N-terminal cleavage/methylation domain-containing protein [Gordonibacter]|uniref:Prepilin-type N-terminal cleavage/methylation domain-containing protein n=1 Tax=Gordonibacter faecis TaxID=3047475 RepID=A0ABT7DMZ4_9ACTN|nr:MULTISPECIES: prepilin-type N-terminal cleavage/methylation domain-containing protein [unclassified Gordonibacter]MDJ1649923.1 prepilin-type N-terminal cleavage/methylation domain-containing protein [Gordonibacter sp. KGMB12511]